MADLAAAYAFGIARNHPFVDDNKRTPMQVSFPPAMAGARARTIPQKN